MNPSQPRAVAVAACASTFRGVPSGSDAAILAAVASGCFSELLVVRGQRWLDEPVRIGQCGVRVVRPPMGQPWACAPVIRREARGAPVTVWADRADLGGLRGFRRAAASTPPSVERISAFAGWLRDNQTRVSRVGRVEDAVSTMLVLASNPQRVDARAMMFAASLAAVSGYRVRLVVPRGTRNVGSAIRYARRLALPVRLEVCDGPSWLATPRADVVFLDRCLEASTTFGPSLMMLAEAFGHPVVDVPGAFSVGERNARRYGQPLLEALARTSGLGDATVFAA